MEYELTVQPSASDPAASDSSRAPFVVSGVRSTLYTVDDLESSTDYTVRVRARTAPAGWSQMSEAAVLRTGPPPRLLPAPQAPTHEPPPEQPATACATVQLRLPALRRGCARETALTLEYREAGGEVWRAYADDGATLGQSDESSLLLVRLPREHSRTSVDFRLRAERGPIISEPSAVVGPVMTCEPPPVRSPKTVIIAFSIALVVIVLICCLVRYRAGATSDGFSNEKPPRKEPGMTRLKTTDDDDALADSDDDDKELSVHYKLGSDDAPLHGMLPLAGISNVSELLRELAEFGCELQDDVILSTSLIEVEYKDAKGKTKMLGPRTRLSEVIDAGEATVITKAAAQQRTCGGAEESVDGIAAAPKKSVVAVTRAPRPLRAAP